MAEEESDATSEQRRVMQHIYDHFREQGTWPMFGQIDRPLRKAGIDPVAVLREIAQTFLPRMAGRIEPAPQDVMRLTIQGIEACAGGSEDVDHFVRVLPWLAKMELEFVPGSGPGEDYLKVTSEEVSEYLALPDGSGTAVRRLYEIFSEERAGVTGSGIPDDGNWYVYITRDVSRFANVQTLADYLEVQQRLRADWSRPSSTPAWPTRSGPVLPFEQPEPDAYVAASVPDTYIGANVVALLEGRSAVSEQWDCQKLLQLITELNDNYATRNVYACHALLRAILDHVPPILGCNTFGEVVNNYSWGQTDRRYMKHLLTFKAQGDDALHRQISKKPDVLRFEDLPSGTWVNALIQECASEM